jgi:hypothetical protein
VAHHLININRLAVESHQTSFVSIRLPLLNGFQATSLMAVPRATAMKM